MIVKQATFISSATDYKKCPEPTLPEFAFIGRSNVGKSSLINMLVNKKGLAKTSSTPGKTQLINHFLINNNWYLVDLPGYGYAKSSRTNREKWYKMMKDYVAHRENIVCIFILIDSRIPFQKSDHEMISWMGENQIPFIIIFTKADKISQRELMSNVSNIKVELKKEWDELPYMIVSSSEEKKGREEILDLIETHLK